jgi:hypothetical protein
MSTTYTIRLTKTVDGETVAKDLGRRYQRLSDAERAEYGAEGWEQIVTVTEVITVTSPDGSPIEADSAHRNF